MPAINAVKADIMKLNAAIIVSDMPIFEFKNTDAEQLKSYILNPNKKAVRILLKILAYNSQNKLLPDGWEIEHIFPQKWQTNYFPNDSEETIKENIEHIGNKLPFEKKLNIVAGNGYFLKKKEEYNRSEITITRSMGASDIAEWGISSINNRDIEVTKNIISILEKWNQDYLDNSTGKNKQAAPSKEDLARIEEFKRKGWI